MAFTVAFLIHLKFATNFNIQSISYILFMCSIHYLVCKKSNMKCAASGSGSPYRSEAPEFTIHF